MKKDYTPNIFEKEIQYDWNKNNVYKTKEIKNKKKFLCISMLPYTSGKLHVGHIRNYTINDIICRYHRMKGYNVLMPMGWDAFGMPAENAAILNKTSPSKWTYNNISLMKKQMISMGFSIDWSKEIITCDPNYYKWTQLMFLKMLKKGIIYKKTGIVNWDPIDKTVLANEQVIDGKGWRSGAFIKKKKIPMYYIKITKYANELLSELPNLNWPNNVKKMQKNWIGKIDGYIIKLIYKINNKKKKINIFTKKIYLIMGITFCAISIEHPLSILLSKTNIDIKNFININKHNTQNINYKLKKNGIATKIFTKHPITKNKIQIWIVNYIKTHLIKFASIGIPAHNINDFYFAKKHKIKIKQIIFTKNKINSEKKEKDFYPYKENYILINSYQYNGLNCKTTSKEILKNLKKINIIKKKTIWRLQDWGISRQRYWGTPIPIINCNKCGEVKVPKKNLPVILPENIITYKNKNPLINCKKFTNCICPKCGNSAKRETDTLDTFVDSSWYFYRYIASSNNNIINKNLFNYWMPIDQYIGGIEHSILHLLYTRFWTKACRDLGILNINEPIKKLFTQGMVLNKTYYYNDKSGKKIWNNPKNITTYYDKKTSRNICLNKQNIKVKFGGLEKMSKSKNNGINIKSLINKYGADVTRLFIMFSSPPDQQLEWSDSNIEGSKRFIIKLWNFSILNKKKIINHKNIPISNSSKIEKKFKYKFYKLLQQINFDYKRLQYNTVISTSMKIFNTLEKTYKNLNTNILYESYSTILRILYPIIPHITYKIWNKLNYSKKFGEIINSSWPNLDYYYTKKNKIKLMIQINNKVHNFIFINKNESNNKIKKIVLSDKLFKKKYNEHHIKNIYIVKNKLINILISKKQS